MAAVSFNSEAATPSTTRERNRGMSSIDKLLVQGIRSFGPSGDDKAVIKFGTPLTLITGQNGAGKTTIIECLRYATTGEMPPNSKGGAFVHDPKLLGEREVKGVVKLKFRDITGSMVVCSRMLQSTQKPRKVEQRTLDSSMEKILPNGQKIKITSRCGEIDREMISHLGVSKAILNHVVFCHQEESSWPLSEGKALKTKFDEIFASTRYTKALENIRSFQKEQVSECKVFSAELMHLTKQKEKVEEIQGNLKDTQMKVEASKAEITRIKNELSPVEDRYHKLDSMYNQVTLLEKRIAECETSKKELLRNIETLRSKIKQPFTGSMAELQHQLDEHQSQLEMNERELREVERKHKLLERDLEMVKSDQTECYTEHGRLTTEENYHKDRVKQRDIHIVSLASKLKLDGFDEGPFSVTVVKQFLAQVVQLRQDEEDKAARERQTWLEKENSLQSEVDDLRTNLASLEQSKTMKEKALAEKRKTIRDIADELAAIGSGAAALEGVEQELSSTEGELTEYKSQVDFSALETSVRSLQGEKRQLDDKVKVLQQELSSISQQASVRGALDACKKEKRKKEEDYQNQMFGIEADLLNLLGHIPSEDEDLERKVTEFERGKNKVLRSKLDEQKRVDSQLSRQKFEKEQKEKLLAEKKKRMEELQAEVSDVCGGNVGSFDEILERIKQDIEDTNENISTIKGSQSFFRKSLEKVHATKKCPLCTRGFDDQESLDTTISSITTRLNQSIPKVLPVMAGKLEELQVKQKRLHEIKPKIDELSVLRTSTVPQLEKKLKEKMEMVKTAEGGALKVDKEVTELRSEMEQVRALQPRVVKVSQLQKELKELDKKISSEESKLGGGDSGRSHHIVNRELQEAQRNTDEVSRKMEHKRQELNECHKTLQQLRNRVHELKEEKLQLQSQLQKRETLVSKREELTAEVKTLDREIKTLARSVQPVKKKMLKLEQEKRHAGKEREEAENNSRREIDRLKADERFVEDRNQVIMRYLNSGSDKVLSECESRLSELSNLMKTKESEKSALESKIKLFNKQLANGKVREHELSDSLQMMKQEEEAKQKEAEIKRLKDQLRSMGLEGYEDEFGRIQQKVDQLRKEQARREGQKQGQEEQVRLFQRELQSDLYSGTETRHRDMLAKLKTTERANKDLEKYYKALDRAIMRYHSLKMNEINKIIKELWIKTYKGGDIDTIEIRSEDSNEDGASLTTRRTYNYRVVMIKGSTPLDMRGRCSAGQKVLACIIIRLALAETFCLHSGLLALDEPTTNLDKENIDGLAQALSDIVRDRSKNQKNFQLIIISHDQDFVTLMSRSGYAECYYEVSKRVGECSKITRRLLTGT